ncbi:MAG: hypothetical protein WCE75_16350 [Terracidiphilus sp.]
MDRPQGCALGLAGNPALRGQPHQRLVLCGRVHIEQYAFVGHLHLDRIGLVTG